MVDPKNNKIVEIVVIAAVVFLLWRLISRKQRPILSNQVEPITTAGEMEEQFKGNISDCDKIIYRPLSQWGPYPSNLLGQGYCYRGDGSVFDGKDKGYGDKYADEQAEVYNVEKTNEAIRVNNKKVIQFRLINSTATKQTSELLNTTQNVNVLNGVDDILVPDTPIANSASDITSSGFTVNFGSSLNAIGYYLDIATDVNFLNYITGYQNKDIGNVLTYLVIGLIFSKNYYYRVRAYNSNGTSSDSNIILATTSAPEEVTIGTQVWMKNNIDINISGSTVYDGDEGNRSIYGGLYDFDMVAAINAAYPGYHVPTLAEFSTLRTFLGGAAVAGGKLKEVGFDYWDSPNTDADDSSGFSARGGGVQTIPSSYNKVKIEGRWLIDQIYVIDPVNEIWIMILYNDSATMLLGVTGKNTRNSVRLIKD